MVRKTYLPEQIINKLREAEILLNQGATIVVMLDKPVQLVEELSSKLPEAEVTGRQRDGNGKRKVRIINIAAREN